MKRSGRITAVLLSAAIASSFTGVTAFGDAVLTENMGSSCVSEVNSTVYGITEGKSRKFSVKMKNVKQPAAKSSNSKVAKVTAISQKNGKVYFTVKGVSEGTATIKVYDKKNTKNYKTIKVRVEAASSESTASDNSQQTTSSDNSSNSSTVDDYVQGVFKLVNEERTSKGIKELTLNESLCEAAAKRAKEVGSYFSHTRPDGTSCFTVLGEYNISYHTAGENIAQGQWSPEMVMNSWMNSSGHKANILNSSFSQIGIGYDPDTNSWVQLFIG